jgi:hypothetical protein
LAVLAVLLLRGPQTIGELRGRTANLHSFADLEAVQHALNKLATREPEALAAQMSRAPGTKEPRWRHLFAPPPETAEAVSVSAQAAPPGLRERVEELEGQIKGLREQVETLRKDLDELRSALL